MTSDFDLARELREHIEREETRLNEGADRMERIEQDLRPLRNLYHALIGAGSIAGLLVAMLVYVYSEDRMTIKQLGDAIYKQGITIEKLILRHEELERDNVKEYQRLEKEVERMRGRL